MQSDIWLPGPGTEGQFSAGGGEQPTAARARQDRSSPRPAPTAAACLEPQPGQKITHVLTHAEIPQNIWKKKKKKRQCLPKSDKTVPCCKIILPRFSYATDQNCQVIPILPSEQKMTVLHMQPNTALDCTALQLSCLSPKEAHSASRSGSEDFLQPKARWPTQSSAQHTKLCNKSTHSFWARHPAPSCPTSLHIYTCVKSHKRAEHPPNNNKS